ncbi:MAG: hypothetical protein L0Z50_24455 [Verrucomicrobiales bacterium]|nr:hypothetical protein [Verrucomicrobiales bacterium]
MRISPKHLETASAALIALVTISIIGFVLASYLTLIRAQNVSTMRAQAWNTALPMSEAGIEEALTHINTAGSTNWEGNGWTLSSGFYVKSRDFTNYSWIASISATDPPAIVSTGFVATVANGIFASVNMEAEPTTTYASRAVRVNTAKDGLFTKAMVAKNTIDLKGNNIQTDSFDSANPLYSTNGLYDPNPDKIKDNGDIATNSGIINSISVGNANIWGRASTGPGGSVSVGPNGAVGSKAWNMAGSNGVEPGWVKDDMNVSFPDITAPFAGGFTPMSGSIGATTYTYLLGTADYIMSNLNMSGGNEMYVNGHARLYVTTGIQISGNAKITIATNASLKIYMGGASASIGGNGVANHTGNAANFAFLGLPTHTSLSFSGNGAFTGVIYTPNADFTLGGGGNDIHDFIGSSVTKTVAMNGHFHFHYDENLANSQWSRGYIAVSWDEI